MGVLLTSPRPAHASLNWDTAIEADLAALAAGINNPATVPSGDLNSISLGGNYFGSGLANAPLGDSGYWWISVMIGPDSQNQVQVAHSLSSAKTSWRRFRVGTIWQPWTQFQMLNDTGWSLAPIAAASGWNTKTDPDGNTTGTLTGGVRNVNGLIEYRFRLNRSGADVNGTASGNIGPDVTLATINPTTYPQFVPATVVEGRFGVIGVQAGTVRIDATGLMVVTDIYPNDSIANGSTIQVQILGHAG